MTCEVQVYIDDQLLGDVDEGSPAMGFGQATTQPAFTGVGEKLREILAALRPDQLASPEGMKASSVEFEIGFSLELSSGGVVKLFIAPKAGVSCKAKVAWKRD